jgi:primosomal protein N'
MALAKQDMVTRLDTLSYRRLKRMRELFMDTDIRACYMDEFKKRKGHFEILAKGKEGEKDVQKLDKKIKDKTKEKHQRLLEKFFQGTQLSELDESNINAEIETLEEDIIALKAQKDQLLQNQDVALVDRLTELKAMKGKNGYVMTKSREDLFNEAVEQFLAGNHILLKGDTGSGKTALAGEVISYIEELSEGKISILKVDGKKLEQEARDPEFLRRQEIMVFSG